MTRVTGLKRFPSLRTIAAIFMAVALSAPVAAPAQSSPQGAITIPETVQIFGPRNPNVRRATAVVNGDIITGTDVDQRLALILAANQNKVSDEEMQRLRAQVLRNLIDETLQIQEAAASKIEVEDAEVEQSYARVAAQNFNQNTTAMDAYLKRIGSSPASLKRQIKGELAWQRLLQRNVSPFVNVSDDEVKEMLERLKAAARDKLQRALAEGRPGRAALDVYEQEPIYDPNYWALTMPNVLCTPHMGYVERRGYEYYFGVAFQNVVNFFTGQPENVKNPEVLGE